jgi:hypothetical protein
MAQLLQSQHPFGHRPIGHQSAVNEPIAFPAYQLPSQSYLPPPAQKPTTARQVTPAQQPARPAYLAVNKLHLLFNLNNKHLRARRKSKILKTKSPEKIKDYKINNLFEL